MGFLVTAKLTVLTGQRYDVIIDAKQPIANYFFRVGTGGGRCDGPNEKINSQGAIFTYDGAAKLGTPESTEFEQGTGCEDQDGIVPWIPVRAPRPTTPPTQLTLTFQPAEPLVFWRVNNEAMFIDWRKPTLQFLQNGTFELPQNDNGLTIQGTPDGKTFAYWVIQNNTPVPHPMHLHGHDFLLLAQGNGTYVDGVTTLGLRNPTRRDTASVAAGGFIVIAFAVDNPGVWLFHCHIPFHISGGMGVQFLERPDEILSANGDLTAFDQGCRTWNTFQNETPDFQQFDSGL